MIMAMLATGMATAVYAAENTSSAPDSTNVEELNEVVVRAVKAPKNSPFAVTSIGKAELNDFATGTQELPFLFARTPGIVAWSENGVGTGTTYMRIRGAAGSRINVTLDGVALNSPEDQCVFWANMNSYASLLGNVQIQRGVGTSTNGDGAFGGSIALTSLAPSMTPHAQITGSYGSYNTWRAGGNISSGLLGNHWVLDAAYHHTGTDGYIHGTDGKSGSYYLGATYLSLDSRIKVSYKHFGNYENTGQAWNGVTAGNDDYSLNAYAGVQTYSDMYSMGFGKFNSLYEHFIEDWTDPALCTTERHRLNDGSLWQRTTDNFWQNHHLLNASWRINDHFSTSATLHYTHGHGYYEEFRYNNKLSKFGLTNSRNSKGDPIYRFDDETELKRSDFIRRKGLSQNTYGLVWNLNYTHHKWNVAGGLSMQNFEGNHYGYLTYIADNRLSDIFLKDGRYRYYDSDATKNDIQLFAKVTYHLASHWDIYGDLQFRHVGYQTNGINDKFYTDSQGISTNQPLNITQAHNFLNPKLGFTYHKGPHQVYASYALSHREPERNNYTDNGAYPYPKAESVHDLEIGYGHTGRNWHIIANAYAMIYHNQLVQTGAQSDIGENLTTNINSSYRIGIELSGSYTPCHWLNLEANAAISTNRISDFTEMVEDWDWSTGEGFIPVHYDNSAIAFSPTAILNGFATFRHKGFRGTWHTNFVSRQYLDNTQCTDRSLPSYSTTAIHLRYDWNTGKRCLKHVIFGVDLNNIFNARYASSGWVYSAVSADYGFTLDKRYNQIGYIPMAGFTAIGSLTLQF